MPPNPSHPPTPLPVSAVLLAAGGSERFSGDVPKQLALFRGDPLVRRAARAALASGFAEVLVVTGFRADEVEAALGGLEVTLVRNPDWAAGQSTSVRAGLARVSPGSCAALFLTCDQPGLTAEVLDRLIGAYRATRGPIVLPVFRGRRGSPVLFDRSLFAELMGITGDTGGRQVVRRYPDRVVEVTLDSETALVDVDTVEELEALSDIIPPRSPS